MWLFWRRFQEKSSDHWPRLFSEKKTDKQYVSTDWSRYIDEDEEDVDDGFDMCVYAGASLPTFAAGARSTAQPSHRPAPAWLRP